MRRARSAATPDSAGLAHRLSLLAPGVRPGKCGEAEPVAPRQLPPALETVSLRISRGCRVSRDSEAGMGEGAESRRAGNWLRPKTTAIWKETLPTNNQWRVGPSHTTASGTVPHEMCLGRQVVNEYVLNYISPPATPVSFADSRPCLETKTPILCNIKTQTPSGRSRYSTGRALTYIQPLCWLVSETDSTKHV